jgi:hypothetical protein
VRPDAINAHRILTALEAFGFASVGLTQAILSTPIRSCNSVCPPCVLICSPRLPGSHGTRRGRAGPPGATGIFRCPTLAASSSCQQACHRKNERRGGPGNARGSVKPSVYSVPNQALEPTPSSVRSSLAPAFWRGSLPALGFWTGQTRQGQP